MLFCSGINCSDQVDRRQSQTGVHIKLGNDISLTLDFTSKSDLSRKSKGNSPLSHNVMQLTVLHCGVFW